MTDDMAANLVKAETMADTIVKATIAGYEAEEWNTACEHCPADLELVRDPEYPGVVQALIYHDGCPTLLKHSGNRAERRAAKRRNGGK